MGFVRLYVKHSARSPAYDKPSITVNCYVYFVLRNIFLLFLDIALLFKVQTSLPRKCGWGHSEEISIMYQAL